MYRQILPCLAVVMLLPAVRAEPPLREVKHNGPVSAVAWSRDGKLLASAGRDGVILLTDAATGKEHDRINAANPVKGLAFSPDGRWLGAADDTGPLMTHELATKKQTRMFAFKNYKAPHLAFTADNNSLVAAGVGVHMIWHFTRGGAGASGIGRPPDDGYAAVAPDGSRTAWGTAEGLVRIQAPQGGLYVQMKVGPARSIAFSPDGKLLASGNADNVIRLWDLGTKQEVRRFEGLRQPAWRIVFSADGKTLAAVGATDMTVRVWNVESGRLRRQLLARGDVLDDLALSPDGRLLATAGRDDRVRIWNLAVRDVERPKTPLKLTAEELGQLWEDLADTTYEKADGAFRKLAAGGENALPFLRQQLRRVAIPEFDRKRLEQLISDLDAKAYSVRQKAFAELMKHGELAEKSLRKLLEGKPSPEAQRRATQLLDKLKEPALSPERVRALEAVELLEVLATPEARRVLEEIARDGLIARIRTEAAEALRRLGRQQGAPP